MDHFIGRASQILFCHNLRVSMDAQHHVREQPLTKNKYSQPEVVSLLDLECKTWPGEKQVVKHSSRASRVLVSEGFTFSKTVPGPYMAIEKSATRTEDMREVTNF